MSALESFGLTGMGCSLAMMVVSPGVGFLMSLIAVPCLLYGQWISGNNRRRK